MKVLAKIAFPGGDGRLILTWQIGEARHTEEVVLATEYAASEAYSLLSRFKPGFLKETLVRRILKTSPRAPKPPRA